MSLWTDKINSQYYIDDYLKTLNPGLISAAKQALGKEDASKFVCSVNSDGILTLKLKDQSSDVKTLLDEAVESLQKKFPNSEIVTNEEDGTITVSKAKDSSASETEATNWENYTADTVDLTTGSDAQNIIDATTEDEPENALQAVLEYIKNLLAMITSQLKFNDSSSDAAANNTTDEEYEIKISSSTDDAKSNSVES